MCMCVYIYIRAYTKVVGLISAWATHLRAGLDDPCSPFQTRILCEIYEHRMIHLISLHEHVDDSGGTMAPVNQSVSLIAQR